RPGGRDTVEMVPVEALTGEEDRVQAPCAQRLTGLEPSLGLLQAGDDLVEARAAGPHRPAGVLAGIVADVGLRPEPTAVGMGMRFDHAGEDDGFGIAVIDSGRTVALEFCECPDGADPAVADQDRLTRRL